MCEYCGIRKFLFSPPPISRGGGARSNSGLNLESIPLLWMQQEALIAGLHFLPPVIDDWTIDDSAPHNTLRDGGWRVLELLPIAHERHTSRAGASTLTR